LRTGLLELPIALDRRRWTLQPVNGVRALEATMIGDSVRSIRTLLGGIPAVLPEVAPVLALVALVPVVYRCNTSVG
jgi:hypothetical protein